MLSRRRTNSRGEAGLDTSRCGIFSACTPFSRLKIPMRHGEPCAPSGRGEALAAHPEAGRPIENLPSEFREWRIPFGADGYIALYRHDGRAVAILAVCPARLQSFPSHISHASTKEHNQD
jgi:hypothetical protein